MKNKYIQISFIILLLSLIFQPLIINALEKDNIESQEEFVNKDELDINEESNNINKYCVYYDINGNKNLLIDENKYESNSNVMILSIDDTNIIGWSTKENSNKVEYNFYDEITITNHDIILYPVYKIDNLRVYYSIDENISILEDKNLYSKGDKIKLLSIDDKNIIGWSLDKDSKNIEFKFGDEFIISNQDITFYPVYKNEISLTYLNSFDFINVDSSIVIDGEFNDWNELPYSYEYNWDNSQNCWYWGVWIDDVCYKTPEGTYSTDVRNKMQLYTDGKYIYLHIIIARCYDKKFNGEDYIFYFGDNEAAFQIEWPGGGTITGNLDNIPPNIYPVEVRHRNSSMSYDVAKDSNAYLKVNPNNINNELELKIPIDEMVYQNNDIDPSMISTIEFFTPNLMYRRISCAGTPTYPIVLAIICLSIVGISFLYYKKNKKRG